LVLYAWYKVNIKTFTFFITLPCLNPLVLDNDMVVEGY
jgi:hypothetical protein